MEVCTAIVFMNDSAMNINIVLGAPREGVRTLHVSGSVFFIQSFEDIFACNVTQKKGLTITIYYKCQKPCKRKVPEFLKKNTAPQLLNCRSEFVF